jgi:hypothetical protein
VAYNLKALAEEATVQKSGVLLASIAGAAVGSVLGYLFFTPQGRAIRRSLESAFDDTAQELTRFRGTLAKASAVASEGWRLLDDFGDALGDGESGRYGGTRQTNPF